MSNKSKAYSVPTVIGIVFVALVVTVSLASSIVFAALSISRSLSLSPVGEVAALNATVSSGSVSVSIEVDCVMRATPLASGVTFGSSWIAQDNGWYYYNKVIKTTDSTKSFAITGATASNIAVELMQAQYSSDDAGTPKGGFILEWASRNMNSTDTQFLGEYTTDGLQITYGGATNSTIVMYSGHNQARRVPSSESSSVSHFSATKSGSYFVVDKVNITDTAGNYDTITSSNAITLYNNSNVHVVYALQVINGGHEPTKASVLNNGNWTTYIDTAPTNATNSWVLASSSNASSGYTTYFVSKPVAPGGYVDLTSGSDTNLYFDFDSSVTSTELHFSVTSLDTMSFYNNVLGTPTTDKYLSWLSGLGATYLSDFQKVLANS